MGKHQDFLEEEGKEQNQPLIRLLRNVYQPGQQDARSMVRIRQRLLSNNYPQTYTQQKRYGGIGSMNSQGSAMRTSRSHQRRRVLVAIAAVLSFVLVISFLVVILNLMRRPSLATTSTPAVITTTSAIAGTPTPNITVTSTSVLPHTPTSVMSIHMVNSTTGWIICADGSVLRTTDGGLNWADVTPPALLSFKQGHGEEGSLFPDSSTAWIVVLGNANTSFSFHTSDAGQTWQKGTIRANESLITAGPYYEVTAISTQEAWALETRVEGASVGGALYGMTGLYHTTDGGKTWKQASNPPGGGQNNYAPAISFTDQHTGIVTSGPLTSSHPGATVALTQDGGASWRSIRVQSPDPAHWKLDAIFSPQFLTPNDGIFMGAFKNLATGNEGLTVFSTHDGGQTWTNAPMENVGGPGGNAEAKFFDPQRGYVLAYRSPTGPLQFYTTSDGGQHWNMIPLNLPKHYGAMGTPSIDSLDFRSLTIGWALEYPTSLYSTADGSKTWTQVHAHFPSFITPKSAY